MSDVRKMYISQALYGSTDERVERYLFGMFMYWLRRLLAKEVGGMP